MALPPLPASTTPRLIIRYTSNEEQHTVVCRLPLGANEAAAIAMYNTIAAAMAGIMWTGDSVEGADFIAAGTNIGNPLAVSSVAGTVNITPDGDHEPNFFSFTGRGTDGRKVKWGMYSALIDLSSVGYRDATPPAPEAAVLAAIQSAGVRTISGSSPVWHSYVNYGANAYWQREARG